MPEEKYTKDGLTRVDVPLPFFMRDDPFDVNMMSTSSYSWRSDKPLCLLLKNREGQSPLKYKCEVGEFSTEGNPLECPFNPLEEFDFEKPIVLSASTFTRLEFPDQGFQPQDMHEIRTLIRRIRNGDDGLIKYLGLSSLVEKEQKKPICFIRETSGEQNDLVSVGWNKESFTELRAYEPFYTELASFDMDSTLLTHLPTLSSPEKLHSKPAHQQVYSIYDIDGGGCDSPGKVLFEFSWTETDHSKLLCGIPPPHAKAKVTIWPKPAETKTDLTYFWKEIGDLERTISSYESATLPEYQKTYYRNQDISSQNLEDSCDMNIVQNIRELVQKPFSTSWTLSKEPDTSFKTVLESVANGDRADIDFTDQVWGLLKGASTPAAYDGIAEIFDIIERGYWKPYLLPTNKTTFVKILKDLHTGELSNFRSILTPKLAHQMVIEFGITKLERDFIFLCTMCHLLDRNDDPISLNIKNFRDCLVHFQKLYCLVEIICLASSRFGLPPRDNQHFAQTFYKQIPKGGPFDWNNVYHFDHPIDRLIPLVANAEPIYRSYRFETEGALRSTRTNIIFTRDCMVPQAQRKHLRDAMDRHGEEAKPWYPYVYSVLERRTV